MRCRTPPCSSILHPQRDWNYTGRWVLRDAALWLGRETRDDHHVLKQRRSDGDRYIVMHRMDTLKFLLSIQWQHNVICLWKERERKKKKERKKERKNRKCGRLDLLRVTFLHSVPGDSFWLQTKTSSNKWTTF